MSAMGFPYKFSCFPNDLPRIYLDISPCVLNISRCTSLPVYCADIMQGANRKKLEQEWFDLQFLP